MGCQATLEEIAETIDRSTLHQPSAGLREFLSSLPQAKRVSDRRKSELFGHCRCDRRATRKGWSPLGRAVYRVLSQRLSRRHVFLSFGADRFDVVVRGNRLARRRRESARRCES